MLEERLSMMLCVSTVIFCLRFGSSSNMSLNRLLVLDGAACEGEGGLGCGADVGGSLGESILFAINGGFFPGRGGDLGERGFVGG